MLAASLVWIALLPLAAVGFLLSGAGGTGWIVPTLLGGAITVGLGLLIGISRLGLVGYVGTMIALVLVALIPIAATTGGILVAGSLVDVMPQLLSGWIEYLLRLAAAAGVIGLAAFVASRFPLTVGLPARVIVPLGLACIGGWVGVWVLLFAWAVLYAVAG